MFKKDIFNNIVLQRSSLHLLQEKKKKEIGTVIILFIGMIAFKIAIELGYYWLSFQDSLSFPMNFSLIKYIFSTFCSVVLFFAIRHNSGLASSFFLYLVYLFQIIPISTVYAFGDRNSVFYAVLCLAYLLCCLVVGFSDNKEKIQRNNILSKAVAGGYSLIALLLIALVVLKYGLPSLQALNIYSVYELRESGEFELGKYANYLFTWTTAVILPSGIALCITKRKYVLMAVLSGIMLMLYLYSGHKTFLFAIPFVVICAFWSRRPSFYKELFVVGCFGFLLLVILLWVSPVAEVLFQRVFSLLGRRVLYVPANNKFHYYEYFSTRPKMGIGGIIPRWLFYVPNHYENIPYTYEISAIFYGKPDMNSNTGFLAEGYMRFGHLGTFLILLLFAIILKQVDRFQERVGYSLAVGVFIYQIYSLSDAYLLESLVLGPWMLLILILLFCTSNPYRNRAHNHLLHLKKFSLFKR